MCVLNKLAVSCAPSKNLIGKESILCGAWVAWVGRRGDKKSDLYKCVTCRINSGSGQIYTRSVHTTSTKEVG